MGNAKDWQRLSGAMALALTLTIAPGPAPAADAPMPIHLDDIHLMVSEEQAAVRFLRDRFGACEMAHPDRPIDYIRFMSLRYGGPTITVTGPTPADEPDEMRAATTGHVDIVPLAVEHDPHWGVRWIALSASDLDGALAEAGWTAATLPAVRLPQEPEARAVALRGPDGLRFVVVERAQAAGPSPFAIDHVLLLVADIDANIRFFESVFAATLILREARAAVIQVADAKLVLAVPEALGLTRSAMKPVPTIPWGAVNDDPAAATIPASVEHLGFLYAPGEIGTLVEAAAARGVDSVYPPLRYRYLGRQTPYEVTEFMTPDGLGVEAVAVDGRVGPHAYYREHCGSHR